jgi:hypothetical protein
MNGETRCSVSGPTKPALRRGQSKRIESQIASEYEEVEEAVEEGRHQQTAPTHDIRGSESTVME